MIKKEVQFNMKAEIEADTIIQLKDGRLLFYYFRENYNIYIYNEKTFEQLFEIDLQNLKYEFMIKFDGDNGKNSNKLKNNEEGKAKIEKDDNIFNKFNKYNEKRNKNSIKELDNGLILIGRDKYLIEINLHKKNYDYKLAKILDDDILEINELSDKRIMVITIQKIILFERKNEEYIFKEEYELSSFWTIFPEGIFSKINQFFFSYVLPNNRLLVNSLLIKVQSSGCLWGEKLRFTIQKLFLLI